MTQEDLGTLCICALRYSMGRQTYMPSLVRDIVRLMLKELSDRDISVMLDDCERQAIDGNYGAPTDKQGWICWQEELRQEQQRRQYLNEGR